MLRVVLHLLKSQDPDPQGYYKEKLNVALNRYGLKVIPQKTSTVSRW